VEHQDRLDSDAIVVRFHVGGDVDQVGGQGGVAVCYANFAVLLARTRWPLSHISKQALLLGFLEISNSLRNRMAQASHFIVYFLEDPFAQ